MFNEENYIYINSQGSVGLFCWHSVFCIL